MGKCICVCMGIHTFNIKNGSIKTKFNVNAHNSTGNMSTANNIYSLETMHAYNNV